MNPARSRAEFAVLRRAADQLPLLVAVGLLRLARLLLFAGCGLLASAAHGAPEPDLTLRGTIAAADHHSYRLVPFDVPVGVSGVEITFDYTGRDARTVIDLGLLGPGESFERAFRGWSGGSKRSFRVSENDATPSYLSGPVTPGRWNLLLGVPNIRATESSQFTAEVHFVRNERSSRPMQPLALKSAAGWYRGDLHMHSGHSDGSCASRSGKQRVPCPLFLTLESAAERGLDFIAITEHNTISHVRELTAAQPYFDELLLIPGMEVTTFQGHANAFGVREPIDFRVGSAEVPDWNALLSALAARNILVSINHPKAQSGEACMGCGWLPQRAANLSRVQAVEIVNGGYVEGPTAGTVFWHEQLQKGYRLTGIGGSDTHGVTSKNAPSSNRIGVPTTVVYASALSEAAIFEGVRSGNVFVDTAGTRDRSVEFSASASGVHVAMGGELSVPPGERVQFKARVRNMPQGRIEIIRDGATLEAVPRADITGDDRFVEFTQSADGAYHWLRLNVRDRDGRLALIGNPIYLNRPAAAQ